MHHGNACRPKGIGAKELDANWHGIKNDRSAFADADICPGDK